MGVRLRPKAPERTRHSLGDGDQDYGEELLELRNLIGQVPMATMQVAQAGSDGQIIEARRLLANLRRKLNRILAEDDPYGDDRLARRDARGRLGGERRAAHHAGPRRRERVKPETRTRKESNHAVPERQR